MSCNKYVKIDSDNDTELELIVSIPITKEQCKRIKKRQYDRKYNTKHQDKRREYRIRNHDRLLQYDRHLHLKYNRDHQYVKKV